MENSHTSIWYIILGAILALATSFIVEIYKGWKNKIEERKNLKIILKLELKNSLQVIDKLVERYGEVSYYDVKVLNQLSFSISRLEAIRGKVIYLKEDSKKEEVLSCINNLAIFQSDILALENIAWKKEDIQTAPASWNQDYYKGQRQLFATRSIDVKRRIQDLLK